MSLKRERERRKEGTLFGNISKSVLPVGGESATGGGGKTEPGREEGDLDGKQERKRDRRNSIALFYQRRTSTRFGGVRYV